MSVAWEGRRPDTMRRCAGSHWANSRFAALRNDIENGIFFRDFQHLNLREKLDTTPATAAVLCLFLAGHRRPPFLAPENLYYSLWYYSADGSNIAAQVQQRRSRNPRKRSAEDFFGQALRERRKEQGLTQEELAFQSGYHATYVGQLERGKKSPSLRAIMSFATVLKTRASELIKRVEILLAGGP